jgi:ketosteroid isomerase-like protein
VSEAADAIVSRLACPVATPETDGDDWPASGRLGAIPLGPADATRGRAMATQAVLDHHLAAFGAGDTDEILKDYSDESVLITADGPIRGLDALRAAFEGFFSGLFAPGTYDFVMDAFHVEGEVAHIVWHADCASADVVLGTDTFVVRDGKIAVQTFAARIDPK